MAGKKQTQLDAIIALEKRISALEQILDVEPEKKDIVIRDNVSDLAEKLWLLKMVNGYQNKAIYFLGKIALGVDVAESKARLHDLWLEIDSLRQQLEVAGGVF